jgi:hypothetical protein
MLLMTHADPGQAGYHHVNCQPSGYWIERVPPRVLFDANLTAETRGSCPGTNPGSLPPVGARLPEVVSASIVMAWKGMATRTAGRLRVRRWLLAAPPSRSSLVIDAGRARSADRRARRRDPAATATSCSSGPRLPPAPGCQERPQVAGRGRPRRRPPPLNHLIGRRQSGSSSARGRPRLRYDVDRADDTGRRASTSPLLRAWGDAEATASASASGPTTGVASPCDFSSPRPGVSGDWLHCIGCRSRCGIAATPRASPRPQYAAPPGGRDAPGKSAR